MGNQNGEHHVQLALTCTRRIDKVVMVKPRFKSNEALDERVYECHSESAAGKGYVEDASFLDYHYTQRD